MWHAAGRDVVHWMAMCVVLHVCVRMCGVNVNMNSGGTST